jgi:hypothetical protein
MNRLPKKESPFNQSGCPVAAVYDCRGRSTESWRTKSFQKGRSGVSMSAGILAKSWTEKSFS